MADDCGTKHNKLTRLFMEEISKITEKISKIEVAIAELPSKIFDKSDERYAQKEYEETLKSFITENNKKTYEWLKYLITALFGAVVAYVVAKFK